jgi:hypothetical protein
LHFTSISKEGAVMLPRMHMFSREIQKFVVAAECLMFHDVTPQSVTQADLQAIHYYIQCLSDKFRLPPTPNTPTNGVQAYPSA